VAGWRIQEIYCPRWNPKGAHQLNKKPHGRIHHHCTQSLQRCVISMMITLGNVWKCRVTGPYLICRTVQQWTSSEFFCKCVLERRYWWYKWLQNSIYYAVMLPFSGITFPWKIVNINEVVPAFAWKNTRTIQLLLGICVAINAIISLKMR
jgi:hypothetical protein